MTDAVADYETAASGFAAVLAQCGMTSARRRRAGLDRADVVDHVTGGAPYYAGEWGGVVPDLPEGTDRVTRYRVEARARRHLSAAGRARPDGAVTRRRR